jgi:hypothetical protein
MQRQLSCTGALLPARWKHRHDPTPRRVFKDAFKMTAVGRNVDFLARVHCFRRAGNIVLNEPTSRRVFKDTFKMMVARLLADEDKESHLRA